MISVIVYGRNDSYGYNLPKRAAMSINCIAHVLDDPDDEIIFVDCNTPNDIPTFPESIADTLTPRARQMLRVLRVRPEQYERGKNGTRFKVLEPLCRNIAIRRSNPRNRWILNTNTDMVFTPLQPQMSLSRIVDGLPDGFYELPRFEMPESLWESCDRLDAEGTISRFSSWGLRLHLNQIVTADEATLFDGPGDFQLALRSQLFEIHGMNEQMVLGWHVDSNLCKRMWLLNGETGTILDRLYAYHCDHTRIQTVYHVAGQSTANDADTFVTHVVSPYIPEQGLRWGMPDEPIEEFSLSDPFLNRMAAHLSRLVPGMHQPMTGISLVDYFVDASLYYDDRHVFPYVADILVNTPAFSDIGYFGNNAAMLKLVAEFRLLEKHSGMVRYHGGLLTAGTSNREFAPPANCRPADIDEIDRSCSAFIFDLSMRNLPSRMSANGLRIPEAAPAVEAFARSISGLIVAVARREEQRQTAGDLLRPCIFIGCHNSWFDQFIMNLFGCAYTPFSTYVRHGFLRHDAFDQPGRDIMPMHAYVIGNEIEVIVDWVSRTVGQPVSAEEYTAADRLFRDFSTASDGQTAMELFGRLMGSAAGRGRYLREIEISAINGMPDLAERLQSFMDQYDDRGKQGT